jgi:hypothetical protein
VSSIFSAGEQEDIEELDVLRIRPILDENYPDLAVFEDF